MNPISYTFTVVIFLFTMCKAEFIVDDFNKGSQKNTLGKDTVVWTTDPSDSSVWLYTSFDDRVKIGQTGYSLRIDYNIQSIKSFVIPQSDSTIRPEVVNRTIFAYCSRVEADVSRYRYLTFYIKGDELEGYPRVLPVEVKDSTFRPSRYVIEGITSEWQLVSIPLNVFKGIDFKNIVEVVFVFDNSLDRKRGRIYIDNIAFTEEFPKDVRSLEEIFYSVYRDVVMIDTELTEYDTKSGLSVNTIQNLEFGIKKRKKDFSVNVYSSYNNERIFFFIDVKDDNLTEKDRIELFFDTNCDGLVYGSLDDFVFVFHPYEAVSKMMKKEGVSYAIKKLKDGYQIELGIDWKNLRFKPEREKILGFAIAAEDRDEYKYSSRVSWGFIVSAEKVKVGKIILK